MSRFTPTPDEVRAYRNAEELSCCEAKRRVRQNRMLREVQFLRDERFMSDRDKFDRLLDVVEEMVLRARIES